MADEAHRGQYGLTETVDAKTGKVKIGTARVIRNTLPNATYIGFTGTPISSKDRSTREVFGDYIDIYDMTQAVEDGATRPVYYERPYTFINLDSTNRAFITDVDNMPHYFTTIFSDINKGLPDGRNYLFMCEQAKNALNQKEYEYHSFCQRCSSYL